LTADTTPLGPTLDGVRTKLARAHEHCSSLDKQIRTFINSKPYRISYEFEPEARKHTWKLETDPPVIPSPINAVIGDALYNFRSALDHIVWQLVLANGGTPTVSNEFPIFIDPEKFAKESNRKLRGVTDAARDIIIAAQPWNVGNGSIWTLHELSNMDKHRHLPIVFVNVTQVTSQIPFPIGPGQSIHLSINTGPIERGTELVSVIHDNVEMDFEPEFGIAFGDGTPVAQSGVMDVFRSIRIPILNIAESLQSHIVR